MRPLKPVPSPPTCLERYVEIRDSKHNPTRTLLTDAHGFVTNRYEAHAEALAAATLHSLALAPTGAELKVALRKCYDSPTKKLQELLTSITKTQDRGTTKYCYYCQTTLPGGWDHYMPADRFPEYSVLAENLIPCCSTCNSTKDDDWLNNAGQRQYIHFGHDVIPDVPFLQVQLITDPASPSVGAKFSLEQGGMSDDEWLLISSHFTRLKLVASYDSKANDEIDAGLDGCCAHLDAGGDDVSAFLRSQANSQARLFGRNHWRAVLWAAMAADPNLRTWVDVRHG